MMRSLALLFALVLLLGLSACAGKKTAGPEAGADAAATPAAEAQPAAAAQPDSAAESAALGALGESVGGQDKLQVAESVEGAKPAQSAEGPSDAELAGDYNPDEALPGAAEDKALEQPYMDSDMGEERLSDYDTEYEADYEGEEYLPPPSVPDPIEGFNRAMFAFNDVVILYVVDPVGDFWRTVVWDKLRIGARNAFYNVKYPIRLVNNLLQGKLTRAGQETGRFLVNTIFGVGGLIEVSASPAFDGALTLTPEDLGQTFGVWGIGNGFYIVWPVVGPSTARDTVGDIGDSFLDPLSYINPWYVQLGIKGGERINDASFFVGEYQKLKEMSLDPYTALKDAYIQTRDNLIAE